LALASPFLAAFVRAFFAAFFADLVVLCGIVSGKKDNSDGSLDE